MAFITIDELLLRVDEEVLIGLTDEEGTGQYDTDKINAALEDAAAIINTYVDQEDVEQNLLKRLNTDIGLYLLWTRKNSTIEEPDKHIRAIKYNQAMDILKQIARGDVEATKEAADRIFTIGTELAEGTLDAY